MRWLFLLLLVLNGVYYVWHQQEAPLRAKEVASLSTYRSAHQDIQLLSESVTTAATQAGAAGREPTCLYLGVAREELAQALRQRLLGMEVRSRLERLAAPELAGYWLRVAPQSRHLLDEPRLQNLAKEFNELKHKIMPCEGIATAE